MNELTNIEIHRLERLEDTITKGMKSFVEVGLALAEIQRSQLFRGQFDTFEDYCQQRWSFTASRGRQLVGAVEAIASLPDELPKPSNASQAEALARIDECRRAEVWSRVMDHASINGRAPTARDIDEMGAVPEEPKEENWLESQGDRNMAEVKPLFAALAKSLKEASDIAERLSKTTAKEWLLTSGSALQKHIRDARDHVGAARPAGACPLCSGSGCRKCFETGWMNNTRLRSFKSK